ncbi:hypothetical protein PHLCEN_2v9323, partial [Hermanssonia centrifuga]
KFIDTKDSDLNEEEEEEEEEEERRGGSRRVVRVHMFPITLALHTQLIILIKFQ